MRGSPNFRQMGLRNKAPVCTDGVGRVSSMKLPDVGGVACKLFLL